MSSQVLSCPACGAPDHSPEQVGGVHVCEHCGSRYRWQAGAPRGEVLQAAPEVDRRGALISLAIVLAVGVAAAAGVLVDRSAPEPPVRATVLEAGGPSPDAVVPPVMAETVPVPPPPPPASAELTVYGTVDGYASSFYVLAEVENTSPYTVERPRLTVVLHDEEGREVFQDDGWTALDVLVAGERSPAKVLVKDPPAYADFTVEVSVEAASWVPERAEGLEVEALDPSVDSRGRYRVGGQVFNRGTKPAQFVEVLLVARDVDGAIVDLDQTYARGQDALPVGEAARFTFDHLDYPRAPATWDFIVTGRAVSD